LEQRLYKNGRFVIQEQDASIGESSLVLGGGWAREDKVSSRCRLLMDNKNGLIFSSSAIQISGSALFPTDGSALSYSILISDENSNEVAEIALKPERSGTSLYSAFTWNLKSTSSLSYVKSGRFTISLVAQTPNEEKIKCCSVECKVADTRGILSTTELLKSFSQSLDDRASKRVLSAYADIIRDIEKHIIDGLKNNLFDEPYYVARTTTGFIEEIYNDIENGSASQFRTLIEEFVSKNPGLELHADSEELGLRALFDFLVNYMADPEDRARAAAMVKCEYRNFTANDRSVILSALVSGILPHCKVFAPPKNVIGRKAHALVESLLKIGIKYVCAKHVDRSIAICRSTVA
jgi:hypothetical protein